MRASLLATLALFACTSDPERLPPPQPGASSVAASSTGAGATGGEGGFGGVGGAASSSVVSTAASTGAGGQPCDVWSDPGCCEQSALCPPGSLGECTVMEQLCGGVCEGVPTPIPNKPCANGAGTCSRGECVIPVGGQGGAGGAGGSP